MEETKTNIIDDLYWMKKAIEQAYRAQSQGEVPVGAIAVFENKIIARAHNLKESRQDPLGHAEIKLISKTSKKLNRWRCTGVSVYVTLEPCLMCIGALMQARIDRLIFGCFDPKAGAVGSLYNIHQDNRLNHRLAVTSGVLEEDCSNLLSSFFKNLRKKKSLEQ